MAYFTKPDEFDFDAIGGDTEPLSRDRVEKTLTAHEWKFQIDKDGDIGGFWDGNLFYFLMFGQNQEILQVRGRWSRTLPFSQRAELLDVLNEWHQAMIWPKSYVLKSDEGELVVIAEHAVDWEHGVSDEQLDLMLRCAITTSCELFGKLNSAFPDPAKTGQQTPPGDPDIASGTESGTI